MAKEPGISVLTGDDAAQYIRDVAGTIDAGTVKGLLRAATHAEGELKSDISSSFSQGGTGQLSRNPKATLLQSRGRIKSAGAFLDLVYADIQDRGGVIYPKPGNKWLRFKGSRGWATVASVTIKGKGYVARAAKAAAPGVNQIMGREIGISISRPKMPKKK